MPASTTREIIIHPWPPLYDERSKILILGTIPSPKSREFGFYYGHPQNIFWKTLAEVLNKPAPGQSVDERRDFALLNRIALWDVLYSCEINGASDLSIRNPVPNQFAPLLSKIKPAAIFTTGKKATELFNKLCAEEAGMTAVYLPSTSPANRAAQVSGEFMARWRLVAEALNGENTVV